MKKSLWERIDAIREKPEHVRMQYVFACLTLSMLFITGIWILSLEENFQSIRRPLSDTIKTSKDFLPKEKTPSLNDLLERQSPLRTDENTHLDGEKYFERQTQNGN